MLGAAIRCAARSGALVAALFTSFLRISRSLPATSKHAAQPHPDTSCSHVAPEILKSRGLRRLRACSESNLTSSSGCVACSLTRRLGASFHANDRSRSLRYLGGSAVVSTLRGRRARHRRDLGNRLDDGPRADRQRAHARARAVGPLRRNDRREWPFHDSWGRPGYVRRER